MRWKLPPPPMVEAGVYDAREHCLGESLQSLVSKIYVAMRVEALDAEGSRVINEIDQVIDEHPANS